MADQTKGFREVLRQGFVKTTDGERRPIHSGTSEEQCEFIQEQMRAIGARRSLEVGLAYGISALAICEQLNRQQDSHHIVMDPYQNTESWEGVGLHALECAGYREMVSFYDEPAEAVLPRLAAEGVRLDFAYIDAGKRLDDTLIYSFFIMQMLRVGGRVVFDDACFPGIREALRYLVQDHRYSAIGRIYPDGRTWKRLLCEKIVPRIPLMNRVASKSLLKSDLELGIAANCVVLEKVSDEVADWKWHPAV